MALRSRLVRYRTLCLALLGLCLLAQPAGHATGASHPRRLTLWLDWYPNADHAGIYMALAKGYYAQAGLDVRVQVPSGAADALKLLAHGTGDMAISYEPDVLQARAAGVPVLATAAIVHAPLTCVLALKSAGITRPRQLMGRTVAVAGLPSDLRNLAVMVAHDGGDPHAVKTVVVNYDLLQALLSHKVDAVEGAYWTWEALQAEETGHAVTVLRVDRWGVPPYDELVFATGERQLARESGVLRAFLAASLRGYAEAATHPAAATTILLRVPGVLSSSRRLIEHSLHLLAPLFRDSAGRYGALSVGRWQAYADWMTQTGWIDRRLDARMALTLALLPREEGGR